MSEAIKFCKGLIGQLHERFNPQLVGVPKSVVNEELQKKQFAGYRFWFDSEGYLFYDLPTIDFSVSTFEKIAKTIKRFEPNMHVEFSESTSVDNEKGIEFRIKNQFVVLMHDRFLVNEGLMPRESHSAEELADIVLKLYTENGDYERKTFKLDRTIPIHC
jgi:hypothetical protein